MNRGESAETGKSNTRQELIRVGTEIIGEQGFGATGINAVLTRAGVPKGSFYHYFPSKERFGLAILDDFVQAFDERLEHFLGDTTKTPLTRLRSLFADTIGAMDGAACARGCMAGNLAQELAGQHELFRERLDRAFRGWEGRFADCLAEAREAGEIKDQPGQETELHDLARALFATWEGAVLRAKVAGSPAPLRTFLDVTFPRLVAVT